MNQFIRWIALCVVPLLLAACGKSPLEQDLAAYAKVNHEIRALENEIRNSKVVMPEQYRAARELENMQTVLEESKERLDSLQMQNVQMQKHVKTIRDGYQAWLDLMPQLRSAVGRGDAVALKGVQEKMATVEEEIRTAEKGIFDFAKIEGYKIEKS